jgi:hypothetical protein
MRISTPVLEDVCKKMIEVILHCLPQAIRGTIYKVGPMPKLRVVLVASGRRKGATDEIQWDGSTQSDYDFPGKVWEDYCDRPGRALEAMAWCIGKQKSWTTDDPEHNLRSIRKQLEGTAGDDYHYMEPVLVEKTDLWDDMPPPDAYPKDSLGSPIWLDSPCAAVAVIKIHFLPGCVKRDDRGTRVIKKLSRSLGTQMLSLHAREITVEKERKLALQHQEVCNTLAHEFRNLTPKIGFAYRAINNEIAYLRESWETLLHEQLPDQPNKRTILQNLNETLKDVESKNGHPDVSDDISNLSLYQEQLMESCLLPDKNEIWLEEKIMPLWEPVLLKTGLKSTLEAEIEVLFQQLRESFRVGLDRGLRDKIKIVPEELKARWVDLAYRELNGNTNGIIQKYINLIEEIDLDLPRKNHSLKNFIYLKALVELIQEIENKLNHRLEMLKKSGINIKQETVDRILITKTRKRDSSKSGDF